MEDINIYKHSSPRLSSIFVYDHMTYFPFLSLQFESSRFSGSHNGTPGDWHALLCRGGNLQSREGSSLDSQSWRGFQHVTCGDMSRHAGTNIIKHLFHGIAMPIQWLVMLAWLDSTWFDTNVTVCILCWSNFHLFDRCPCTIEALVTAKFAGLSIPTKKFDPQKDLGVGRSRVTHVVPCCTMAFSRRSTNRFSMFFHGFPTVSNRQDAKKPDFLARNPTGKAPWKSFRNDKQKDMTCTCCTAGAIPWDWQRLHFYIQCCGKAQHPADMQGCQVREEDYTRLWYVVVVRCSSSFMQRSSKILPLFHKLWTCGRAPCVGTPRFIQMHPAHHNSSDTLHAADLIWHSMAQTLARKATLMNGWSLLCTRPVKVAEPKETGDTMKIAIRRCSEVWESLPWF